MPYYELKITIPEAGLDRLVPLLNEKGALGFIEDENVLTAYFPVTFNIKGLVSELSLMQSVLQKAGIHDFNFSSSLLPDQDWNESWKKGFTPLDVGQRFTILPPWEKPKTGRINLIIDPGMAFGTGHHETTRSCLVLMEKYDGHVAKDFFLDLGTGTGLLAVAAAKLGYRNILALDTDPLATEAARKNLGLNEVENVEVHEGSMSEVSGSYDCITANIISGVLILLAHEIASHLNVSGIAIVSGILSEQADEVIEAMLKAGLNLRERYPDDRWISLVLQK